MCSAVSGFSMGSVNRNSGRQTWMGSSYIHGAISLVHISVLRKRQSVIFIKDEPEIIIHLLKLKNNYQSCSWSPCCTVDGWVTRWAWPGSASSVRCGMQQAPTTSPCWPSENKQVQWEITCKHGKEKRWRIGNGIRVTKAEIRCVEVGDEPVKVGEVEWETAIPYRLTWDRSLNWGIAWICLWGLICVGNW